jgi:hypothetical protein
VDTTVKSAGVVLCGILAVSSMIGQTKPAQTNSAAANSARAKSVRVSRRPPAVAESKSPNVRTQNAGENGPVFVLNGMPMLLDVHHDTEVGTNNPVDVYEFVIEMQVMNSDGDLEPVGLQIHNFFTVKPQDPRNDFNRHNARDCRLWNGLILKAMKSRDPKSKTWPYVEFVTNSDARVLETNEDGQVFWSDDVECWGSSDRFSPF